MNILIFWVAVAAITLVLDIIINSFIFVWFTVGGIAAIIALILKLPFSHQLICFVVVSGTTIYANYAFKGKNFKEIKKENFEKIYNFVITVDLDMIEKAYVEIDGAGWRVKNIGEQIKEGDKVIVVGVKDNRVLIKKQELGES